MINIAERKNRISEILKSQLYLKYDDTISELENYVHIQLENPKLYSIQANLAILNYYLMFRKHVNIQIIRNILILALMNIPSSDFDLCLCQITLNLQNKDPIIIALIEIENLLQTCRFSEFWNVLKTNDNLTGLSTIPDFKNSICYYISGVISSTYRIIALNDALSLLDLSEKEFIQFCNNQTNGIWSCDLNTGLVTIQSNDSKILVNDSSASNKILYGNTLTSAVDSIKSIIHSHQSHNVKK